MFFPDHSKHLFREIRHVTPLEFKNSNNRFAINISLLAEFSVGIIYKDKRSVLLPHAQPNLSCALHLAA